MNAACVCLFFSFIVAVIGIDIPFDAGEYEIDDAVYTWRSPDPYPQRDVSLVVRVEAGYTVLITVTNIDMNGAIGDYLLIKSGSSLDDGRTGRIFTHHLNSARGFVSVTNDMMLYFAVFGPNTDARSGFSVEIQRFGDAPPTTVPPSDEIVWPTPSDEDSIHLLTTVGGRRPSDYSEEIDDFRTAVAAMATEYCNVNNFHLAPNETITKENVHVDFVRSCPSTWRGGDDCAQIQFSVPVFLDASFNRYELTTANLQIMWDNLSDKYLAGTGLRNYVREDVDHLILIWLVTICLTIVLFGLVIYVTRWIAYRRIKASKKPKQVIHQYEEDKKRLSGDSLGPHPLQTVPNLFEPQFPLYEPQLSPKPRYASGVSETELDLQQFTFPEQRHDSSEI